MSVPTNTLQTYTQTSIREDLINAIYNVDPYKTPLLNMAKKTKAEQTKHEWTTDALAAQNTANDLVANGVKIIFNYSEALLETPADVTVHTSNPAVELLYALYFHLT